MVIRIKLKYIIGVIAAGALIIALSIGVSANAPTKAYVRYHDDSVAATVYWTQDSDFEFAWATDMNSSGSDLDWKALSYNNLASGESCVTVSMEKYKNYYFKIFNPSDTDGSDTIIVRAFPGDINSDTGPNKKSNDNVHGNFTPDTKMCGSCHSTHTSMKAQLLKESTYYALCMLCHSNSNTQSKYDVETGRVYMGSTVGWVESLAGPIGAGVGTSAHEADDAITDSKINCISCHTAHGGKNDNYRLIRDQIYPAGGGSPKAVSFNAYAITKNLTVGEQVYYVSGNTEFCVTCHPTYAAASDNHFHTVIGSVYSVYRTAENPFDTDPFFDRYPSEGDNLPLQYYAAGASKNEDKRTAIVCETCHYAHGTRKSYNLVDGSSGKGILRMDNLGMCQSCHKE